MAEMNYTGWRRWKPTTDEWLELYQYGKAPDYLHLLENEYLIVETDDGSTTYYCYEYGRCRKFTGQSIKTYNEKPITDKQNPEEQTKDKKPEKKYSKGKSVTIAPRNAEQICAFDLVKDESKTIKVLTGHWGTGKTMILVTAALEALKNGRFEQIVWIRNNVDVKGTKDLGALPGEVIDKLLPFLGPFIDHAGEHAVRTMLDRETLIVEPLQSLRGRNFKNSLIMCSESENLSKEHIQLIIARAAEGSEVWLDGDTRQRDLAIFERSKGLETLIDKLKGNELFGYVHLVKSERSATAALADLLD